MKKFNNTDLFTGYLKQLLHNFNLPKIKVYTKEHAKYKLANNEESPEILSSVQSNKNETFKNVRYFPYIKNGEIQEYIEHFNTKTNLQEYSWNNIGNKLNSALKYYTYGNKILNYTKNLKIKNNIYDSYTHEYLGDYLRFHRDYLDLNLMPLYNCFSNRACDKLNLSWVINEDLKVEFNTSNPNYKIYMVPIKLFQKYTIAIDSTYPIEMCCGLYGDYQDTRNKFKLLPIYTYMRKTNSSFSQPFIYDKLSYTSELDTPLQFLNYNDKIELAQNEADLKLFIKLPANNDSTIVILEGDYLNWNDSVYSNHKIKTEKDETKIEKVKKVNKSIINLDSAAIKQDIKLITPLQLLQFNTREQHPFADRLIEYLIGNAITNSEDEVSDNVHRAQKALRGNLAGYYRITLPGVWSAEMKNLFYEYMTTNNKAVKSNTNHDILGYVDKDVEKYYQTIVEDKKLKTNYKVSLLNIELEEGDK